MANLSKPPGPGATQQAGTQGKGKPMTYGAQKPDILEQLQEAILEVPSTSVASGLTFGSGQK